MKQFTEPSTKGFVLKNVFLKNFPHSQENTCQFYLNRICLHLSIYLSLYYVLVRHGVKVGLELWGPGPRDPRIRDLGLPSKFKSGTGTPLKIKSGILIIIFLHCLTYFVLENMEISFHE